MPEITPIDFINVGEAGTFTGSGEVHTSKAQVDEIFLYLEREDIENLVVYFHGGLVSEKNGMGSAQVMSDHFTKKEEKRHAVSFVWETGPKEVIVQNLKQIEEKVRAAFFQEALKFVIKLVAKKLGLKDSRGGGGEYLSDQTIETEKQKTIPFESLDKEMDGRGGPGELTIEPEDERRVLARLEMESRILIDNQASEEFKNTSTNDDQELTVELQPEEDGLAKKGGILTIIKIVAQIAFKVLKRYANQTHHDFYPTVMEETFRKLYIGSIGTWGWSRIKDKAEVMFADNAGLNGDDLHAGTYFLESLRTHYIQREKQGKKISIHLVGHSAGSIVICYLLKSVMEKHKDLKFENVFFLAPACRTDLFLNNGVPAAASGVFNKFKMFTMKAENEKKDHCIPFIYTHSLLYMVSGLFEMNANEATEIDAKIMGLNEQFTATGRYGGFPELVDLNKFLLTHPLVLSDDNVNADVSLRSTALKHGDFDNDIPTLNSILNSL